MSVRDNEKYEERTQMMNKTEKFLKLFSELEHCTSDEQKQKIEVMNEIIDEMSKREYRSVFSEKLFDKICKMIEEKKFSTENVVLLLKHVGHYNLLRDISLESFKISSLNQRFEKIIVEDDAKKEKKNEKLLVDLCECYISQSYGFLPELISICVPCLLKAALNKEKSEEAQKEVEMALLALCNFGKYDFVEKELYFTEIKEIIKYHQEHRNLTRLAYQSLWQFLIKRLFFEQSLEMVMVNELHFVRETRRELEELSNCVNWKKKDEERGKETKEEKLLMKWFQTLEIYLSSCELWTEEYADLICSIVQLFRAAKDKFREISDQCIRSLSVTAFNRAVKIDSLLKEGAVDAVLEGMQQPILDLNVVLRCLDFFLNVAEKLKKEEDDGTEETKRNEMKKMVFEKMEEEGYEDIVASF